ncbi:m28 family protein [Cystoisospora suis]|uniref:M28 family protein n=1 Tax=Cystoisospora suis TaxID=483139 RepID=A0A2C6KYZ9_9APIC|nr:m28 family protein [Cystoisospora suis]
MEPTRGNLSHTTIPSSSSSSSSFSSPPLSSPDTKEKHPASIGSRPTEGKSFLSPSSCRRASRFHFSKLLFFVIPPLFPFLLFFAALWAAYVHHTTLPEPVAFSASPFDFSAGRVMAFLSAFTSGVRTLGSCNNELFAPLLMLRFFKEEILHIFPSDLRRTTKAPAENDPPRFSSSTASSPSSSSASSSSSSSSPSTFSSSAHPVILHSLSYSLLVDYDQPSISPADPNQYESARHELPPSHQEGALPRMYPPAILSSLSLCSLKGQEPLVSFPSSGDPSSGTPSFELPEHLSSLFSQLEIPACPEDEKELLQRTCDDSSDFFHHRHSSFSSSQEKQETPGQQTSQTSKGEGPMTSSKTSPSSDPTGSGVSAFFFSGKDSHGGDNPGTENSLYLTFRELANQAVHAYDKSQKERSGLSVHGDDIRVKDSFFQTLLERDVNQALIHPVSTIVASPLPHGAKGEGQDHRSSSSSPSSRSHHPSSTSSSSSSPSVSDLWWEGSLQLKRRCFNYERFFVTTPRIRDLLLKNRKMRDMSHYQRDYKVPRDASLVDQELHRKLVEENIRSSGERKDDRKRRERRDSITDILLDNILVVDISSTSGLSGGSFVKWRDGRHVFYTGLYNLAVRIQPFSEVLKMKKNGGESKEPYRRKRALLLSAHSDSANSSPGASDDGAMVATILEVARNAVYRHLDSSEKLITSSQHRDNEGDKKEKGDMKDDKENSTRLSWLLEVPLIVDINGAEEIGLLGAHGFASLHPMAREIAYAVNLESGGVGGKEIIVQTSGKYGERVLSEYKSAVASPSGFSLAMDVSDMGLFPGETDFRVWRDVLHLEGGIEFAWTSEGFYYHTKYDDIYHMNPGAVQRVGNVVLPLVLRLTEDLSALIKEEEEKHEEIIEEGKRQKNSSDQGVAPGHPSQQKRYHLPSTVEEERDEVKKEEERWGSLFSSFFSRFFPKTSWPQSSSFFADLVGMYLLTCRLSYFEALLGILLVLLLVQVHLEKQVLNITFSFPLLLLSLGSLVLSTLPALLVSALVSQILAVFSIPFITFHDWRLGTALFGLLGGLTFFYTWYRLLFAG